MHPHDAYRQQRNGSIRRIDLILTLFRKALDQMQQARQAWTEGRSAAAQPMLAQTQLIVSALASGHVGSTDPASINFLRLYEYVAHQLAQGGVAEIEGAQKVMQTLLEAFEAIRVQAADLESQGLIPSLDRQHIVQLTA